MRSRLGRCALAMAGVGAVLIPAVVLLRLHAPLATAGAAAAPAAARPATPVDALHGPWFGLQLLDDPITLAVGRSGLPSHPPDIKASAGILIDADTGRILWQLNPHEELPPASTVKLLTAMLVLQNFSPQRLIRVTPDALFQAWDESKMGLTAGEILSSTELLSGMLMVSANDAADTFAVDTVGLQRFVAAMNAEVAVLGLHDTHVTSPVGLDDPQMFSSAYDLATIADVDVQSFPLFDDIVNTRYAVLPANAGHPAFYLDNINLLLSMYPAADGIKTGYTGDAGACEVGMADRDGHRLIDVVLNGTLVYTESKRLLDWGFVQEGLPSQLPPPASPKPKPA